MASGGSVDSSTGGGGPSTTSRTGRRARKRPHSQSSASLEDQATRLQEEDFTW